MEQFTYWRVAMSVGDGGNQMPFLSGWETPLPIEGTYQKVQFYGQLAIALVVAIVGVPVAALSIIDSQIAGFEQRWALGFAREILVRSDRISASMHAAIVELEGRRGQNPCSEQNIEFMRKLALESADFMVVGYVSDNQLLCSSFERHTPPIPIGLADYTGAYHVRKSVSMPTAPDAKFLTAEQNGWIFFVPPLQSIDVPLRDNVSLATYSTIARKLRASKGLIRPDWVVVGKVGKPTSFIDGDYVVAVLESNKYPTGVIAAFQTNEFSREKRIARSLLVAVAIIAGIGVASWIVYLARQKLFISRTTLEMALAADEFYVVYQPIVDLQTRHWVGAEALMRWKRKGGTEISPDIFISVAENMGLVSKITERMLVLVAKDASLFFEFSDPFYLSINLASDDVKSRAIVDRLRELLASSRQPARRFKIEITERSVLDEIAGKEVINDIRSLGMDTIVDDFGTGFSNLKYLTTFKFDYLKIDKAFVQGLGTASPTGEVALHIINIAKSFGLGVIAEGIEHEDQAHILLAAGVGMAQGFLFSRPKRAVELANAMLSTGALEIETV